MTPPHDSQFEDRLARVPTRRLSPAARQRIAQTLANAEAKAASVGHRSWLRPTLLGAAACLVLTLGALWLMYGEPLRRGPTRVAPTGPLAVHARFFTNRPHAVPGFNVSRWRPVALPQSETP